MTPSGLGLAERPRWPGNSVAGPASGATLLPAGGDYVYDWVGNRTRPPADPAPMSEINKMVYNNADQLVMWPGSHGKWNGSTIVPGYVCDKLGNLTNVKDVSGSADVARYTYHPSGLMNQAQYAYNPTTQTWRTLTSTWDADSNRVGMNANGTQYSFVYDTTAGIPAVIEESSGGTSVYYIREPGGELIARVHPSQGIRYYHFDELGSTRLLTDGSGTVTDRYAYDAYGSLISHDGLTNSVDQPYQYVGRLGYYTHHQEPEFGLLQLGVRFYDPQTGRFTQRDPIQVPASAAYLYAGGNPSKNADPTGRYPCMVGKRYALYEACKAACEAILLPRQRGTKWGKTACRSICGKLAFESDGGCAALAGICYKMGAQRSPYYGVCCNLYRVICVP